nr:hypothetical protein [Sulfurimonas sp.]
MFAKVKQDYENDVGYIELVDVEEFEELLDDLKEDDKYYKANIALAVVTFTTKQLALVVQITKTATAASQTYGTALSASIELDIDAVQTQLEEYAQKSIASGVMAESITLRAKNKATIQGSNLQATKDINIDAKTTIMVPFFKTSKTSFLILPLYDTSGNSFAPLGSKLLTAL